MLNPPIPSGYQLMRQLAVTPSMTAWAVTILHDSQKYPMFSLTVQSFAGLPVLARVEWHAPDFQNRAVHRGVTLYAPTQVTPSAGPATGVDVSGYQPTVDWQKVAASGIAFAFIKATEATTLVDHAFARHWAQAKQAKLLRGAYHFFRPKQDAAAQARFFLAQLEDPGELPPVLDVEVTDGVAPAQVVVGVRAWLEIVACSLGRPIIYTSPSFWNVLPGAAEVTGKADLWVAHWGAHVPASVNGWQRWTFWQFRNKASISGIPGTADMDEDRFNGSVAELQAYCAGFLRSRGVQAV
jgi:GH25 family lysozyme M1 (1,4-beta-N-acetylmuramidase)